MSHKLGAIPVARESIVENNGTSWVQDYDYVYIETIQNQVRPALKDFVGAAVSIIAFTPPADPAECLHMLEVRFNKEQRHVSLGVGFWSSSEGAEDGREEFDIDHWRRDPQSAYGGGIVAANFDEAWQIVCSIIRMMDGVSLAIGHGV